MPSLLKHTLPTSPCELVDAHGDVPLCTWNMRYIQSLIDCDKHYLPDVVFVGAMVAEASRLGVEAVAGDAADKALAPDLALCHLALLAQALE